MAELVILLVVLFSSFIEVLSMEGQVVLQPSLPPLLVLAS